MNTPHSSSIFNVTLWFFFYLIPGNSTLNEQGLSVFIGNSQLWPHQKDMLVQAGAKPVHTLFVGHRWGPTQSSHTVVNQSLCSHRFQAANLFAISPGQTSVPSIQFPARTRTSVQLNRCTQRVKNQSHHLLAGNVKKNKKQLDLNVYCIKTPSLAELAHISGTCGLDHHLFFLCVIFFIIQIQIMCILPNTLNFILKSKVIHQSVCFWLTMWVLCYGPNVLHKP